MDARLIGRMILARWLDYPPDRYERLADVVTSSPIYRQMSARIEVAPLPNMLSANEGRNDSPSCAVARLGPQEGHKALRYTIAYRHPAWGKEFRVDGCAPTTGDAADPELDWLLRRLRPINTRNRLTHLILLSVIETQAAFLHSGAWADLEPLSLTALCRWLASVGGHIGPPLPPGLKTLDVSLLSRAARGFTVRTPQGSDLPLRRLLPNAQAILRYRLRALLDGEALELKRGGLERPRNDDELRQQLRSRWGQNASRRAVAAARQARGIPPWHWRAGRPLYPPPGFDFSLSRPLTSENVRAHAPSEPGVYEIALADRAFIYSVRTSPVIYIGRSRNLRNRLRAHLRNHEKFGAEMGEGRFIFRFATVACARLQTAEAELARAFCWSHGALPSYNVVTPSGGRTSD